MFTKTIPVFIFIAIGINFIANINLVFADTLVSSVQVGNTPLILEYDPNSGRIDILTGDSNVANQTIAPWGCTPELTKGCIDMTNASSTYLSIAIGAVVGALISWLVYILQKRSTVRQDENLRRLKELDERHDNILSLIQHFQKHQEKLLEQILGLDKKIDSLIERRKDYT